MPNGRTRRAFTLVELLVVISIVTLLLAMLLPVLAGARVEARRIQGASNLRQLAMGFLTYAQDNRSTLPASLMDSGGWAPNYVYLAARGLDLRPVFRDYNLYPATAHPVLGKGPIESSDTYCWQYSTLNLIFTPWFYLPGYRMASFPQTLQASSPTKIDLAKSNHVMWSDIAWYDPSGLAGPGHYQMSQVSDVSAYNGNGPGGAFTLWTDKPLGAYSGCFDGSVSLRPTAVLRWALYSAGNYYIGHTQPN